MNFFALAGVCLQDLSLPCKWQLTMNRSLVLLVGAQGSGKSTYCRNHLSDYVRISQDDQGRQAHFDLFREAIAQSEPRIVVDRINGIKHQRRRYLTLAQQHGYRTRIVWLNTDRNLCLRRCRERTDHPTLTPDEADSALGLYYRSFQTPSRREADELTIVGSMPVYTPVLDLTAHIGQRRHILLGDVHGCFDEMRDLLAQLAYRPDRDVLLSVGDLIDRGPKIRETLEYLFDLPDFHMVLGNHEDKFLRYLEGNNIKVAGGLQTTIDAYGNQFPATLRERLAGLPLIVKTPSGYVVHAGFDPEMSPEEQTRSDCLYMRFYGGKTYFDEVNGRVWHSLWPADAPRVFFGHIPEENGPELPHVVSLDAGCVFGGALKAFDSRDGRVHQVKARQAYVAGTIARLAEVSPIDAIRRREEYVANGLLRTDRTDDGQLAIYTYTDQCAFENAWDDVTRNARGHIYDLNTGECVASPFPKFFNLGENEESNAEMFPWDQPYEIYEKMDGWLGVLYRHAGQYKVASRGSFHSSGAIWATEFIQRYDLSCLPEEATLCFEIIHPEHKIILNYKGQQTLVILAAFNRRTGEEYSRGQVAAWASATGLPLVPLLGHLSLEDLLVSQRQRQDCEGFVLRFGDGRRVKVKTQWYLELARIMADLTPISVWQTLRGGKVQPEYSARLPEELRPLAEQYQAILEGQYARLRLAIDEVAGPILQQFGDDRKALALHLESRRAELGPIKPAVFLLLDGKRDELERLILKQIYPAGNRFAKC